MTHPRGVVLICLVIRQLGLAPALGAKTSNDCSCTAVCCPIARGRQGDDVTRLLKVLADVFPHLMMPIRPVVATFGSPVIEMMSYATVA